MLRDLPGGLTFPISMAAFNPVDHTVDAGDAAWAFALPQPLVTHTPAPGDSLALADFDDTGLEVETAALLVASAPGTSGNNFYADASRNGSDSP